MENFNKQVSPDLNKLNVLYAHDEKLFQLEKMKLMHQLQWRKITLQPQRALKFLFVKFSILLQREVFIFRIFTTTVKFTNPSRNDS